MVLSKSMNYSREETEILAIVTCGTVIRSPSGVKDWVFFPVASSKKLYKILVIVH